MHQSIVITSIFPPTEAVRRFAEMYDFHIIVVGDRKTPKEWVCDGVHFLSVDDQKRRSFRIAKMLPYDHYSRKMIGYLEAVSLGTAAIIDTDDDNIPKPNWNFPPFDSEIETLKNPQGFINIYELYSEKKIWPRGLPLNLIEKKFQSTFEFKVETARVGVWQGLADEDPDVDAIYRLTDDSPTFFNHREPLALSPGVITPFNSQNTKVRKECFALLYLPTYVTFRFTDILRGLVAQPVMWAAGYQLGFVDATVIQRRNPHNYMKDFESEIPMYLYSESVFEIASAAIKQGASISDNMFSVYEKLEARGIVQGREIDNVEAWLKDISDLSKN